jgi:hypothetical protein
VIEAETGAIEHYTKIVWDHTRIARSPDARHQSRALV